MIFDSIFEKGPIETTEHPRYQKHLLFHKIHFMKLLDMIASRTWHPCWILKGNQGIGKATCSYLLAKTLLSQSDINPHGLDSSVVWHQIEIQSYPNFYSIERSYEEGELKTEITIDQVGGLLHFIRQTPFIPGLRVVLIDSACELNHFAANALLKTLEDPPKNTLILLLAHQIHKVIPTIRSRCQMLNFSIPTKTQELSETLFEKKVLEDLGGEVFLKTIQDLLLLSSEASFQNFAKKVATHPQSHHFSWIFLRILYEKIQKNPRCLALIDSYEVVSFFINKAHKTHLNLEHFIVACFLLNKTPSLIKKYEL